MTHCIVLAERCHLVAIIEGDALQEVFVASRGKFSQASKIRARCSCGCIPFSLVRRQQRDKPSNPGNRPKACLERFPGPTVLLHLLVEGWQAGAAARRRAPPDAASQTCVGLASPIGSHSRRNRAARWNGMPRLLGQDKILGGLGLNERAAR